jgi:ketosteroid isomerase-like protein
MKRLTLLAAALLMFQITMHAQSDLQKLVDTEHAFANAAAANGTRAAFLEFMADDALIFNPDVTNAKAFWTARAKSPSLLSWAPNYADISSNGIMGYTTGNWEYRAKGKDDAPGAFGDFITLWLRRPDGKYRWVVDIGVSHDKPEKYSTEWSTASPAAGKKGADPTREAESEFYQLAEKQGLAKAYKGYAAANIRSYREGKLPILGKKASLELVGKDRGKYKFGNRSTTFSAGDLSYNLNTYSKSIDKKEVEKGNFLQIWKFIDGRWQMVLDIFKPLQ